jgi:uncharacterized Fe-S center protein
MTSDVFFISFRTNDFENTQQKIRQIFYFVDLAVCISKDDLCAIKLHMGERGNDAYIRPQYARQVVEAVRDAQGKPFLTDTNTLYLYKRRNAIDHHETALLNGFSYSTVHAPVIIADGLHGENEVDVVINQKHFKKVHIAGAFTQAQSMIVFSHVKGHILAGFGGALKNLAMGCATIAGKKDQHQGWTAIVDTEACVGCGTCVDSCQFNLITIEEGIAQIPADECYGCAGCLETCESNAIDFDWKNDFKIFIERMMEYAYGSVLGLSQKVGYINLLTNISPFCDCASFSNPAIVPDIGILASKDPVAIDQASIDLINQQHGVHDSLLHSHFHPGEDKFTGLWPKVDGRYQIEYAEKIGMGTRDYRLINL